MTHTINKFTASLRAAMRSRGLDAPQIDSIDAEEVLGETLLAMKWRSIAEVKDVLAAALPAVESMDGYEWVCGYLGSFLDAMARTSWRNN